MPNKHVNDSIEAKMPLAGAVTSSLPLYSTLPLTKSLAVLDQLRALRLERIGVMVEPLCGANQQKNGYRAVAPVSPCQYSLYTRMFSGQLFAFAHSRQFAERSLEMLLYIGSEETKLLGQKTVARK